MSQFVVLEDFSDGSVSFTAGSVIDDLLINLPELTRAGLSTMPFLPGLDMVQIQERYRSIRASGVPQRENDFVTMVLRSRAGASLVMTDSGQTVQALLNTGGGNLKQGASIFFDPIYGDDGTAQRNSLTFPFQTVTAALAAAQDDDTVQLLASSFTEAVVVPGTLARINFNAALGFCTWSAGVGSSPVTSTTTTITFNDVAIQGNGAPGVVATGTGVESITFNRGGLGETSGTAPGGNFTGVSVSYFGPAFGGAIEHTDCPFVAVTSIPFVDAQPYFRILGSTVQTFFLYFSGIVNHVELIGKFIAQMLPEATPTRLLTQTVDSASELHLGGCSIGGNVILDPNGSVAAGGCFVGGDLTIGAAGAAYPLALTGFTVQGDVSVGANVNVDASKSRIVGNITVAAGGSLSGLSLGASAVAIGTTTVTVTLPYDVGGTAYRAIVSPNQAASGAWFVDNKTSTSFDVTFDTASGTFDWQLFPA